MDAIEELKMLESETCETSRQIEEALSRLEKERIEAVRALNEIDRMLPYHLALFYLGEMVKGEMESLQAKRSELQRFVNDYSIPAKEGLENMRRMGHPKDGKKRSRIKALRDQLASYEENMERLRKDLRSRTPERKADLLKGAKQLGLLEEAEAFLKELDEEAMKYESDKMERIKR